MSGDIGKEGKVLVIRAINVRYRLRVPPSARKTVERAHATHAEFCPVARTIGECVEISTEIEYVV